MSRSLRLLLTIPLILLALLVGLALLLESPWGARLVASIAGSSLGREVQLAALDIDWGWPPTVRLDGLSVANADWAGERPMLQAERVLLIPLGWAGGQLSLDLRLAKPRLELARRADGVGNWRFKQPQQPQEQQAGRIRLTRLAVDDGRLGYRDAVADLRLDARLSASPDTGIRAEGSGQRRDQPLRFELAGAAIENLLEPSQPYPVKGELRAGHTVARLEGELPASLRLSQSDLRLDVRGPNPAELYPLLGLSLPDLPPYRLRGRLHREDGDWLFTGFSGRVGDSDLAGDLRVRPGKPAQLWVRMRSERLDLDDLLPTVGGTPAAGAGETASPEQRRAARREQAGARVFPDTPISFERLHAVNADIHFEGRQVLARKLPMETLKLEASLRDGVLDLHPLNFGLANGQIVTRLRLDARENPAGGRVELTVRNVDLKPLVARFGIAKESFGRIGGQGELRFTGNSIAQAMASLDGVLQLAMQGGRLDAFAVEAAGLDFGGALLAKLTDRPAVPINCALVRLNAKNGVAALETFYVNTENTNFLGTGQLDLARERLQLRFQAHPKGPSLFALSSPVGLSGPFKSPSVDVVSGEAAGKLGLAIAGAILAPLAAILPLVEPGGGEEAGPGCREALAEARQAPAAD